MALDFVSPSVRAAGSDLTIAVSPLGLIELADEEFEVHGPRLTRYANAAAFYLGHHWAYRRPPGEPQITANYCAAFSDFLTNFTFSKSVQFGVDPEFTHITPALMDRIWDQDNRKNELLWGIGNIGSIYGDCFVKVAYEPPYVSDETGEIVDGRVRILPLNPSFCFPEWHPHDKDRMIRFRLKYRFWSTAPEGTRMVNTYVEIITDQYIEEYINDELIDRRPNPLGVIPVVHVANKPVAASPWGLSDIMDIIPLNRTFNEVATDILDIINYHCVDDQTEVLTKRGWKKHHEVGDGELILARDPKTDEVSWKPAQFNRFNYSGNLVRWNNRIDALTTPGHRWLTEVRVGRARKFVREIARTSERKDGDRRVADLQQGSRIIVGGGNMAFPVATMTDMLVDLAGWWVTEGSVTTLPSGSKVGFLSQSETANPEKVEEIRLLAKQWQAEGHKFTEQAIRKNGVVCWYLGTSVVEALESAVPGKSLPPEFISALSYDQAACLHRILIDADGTRQGSRMTFYQDDQGRRGGFQMLCALLGIRTRTFENPIGNGIVSEYQKAHILAEETVNTATSEFYEGTVWCPTVEGGIWFARRNGSTYWTGNTAPVTVITGARAQSLEKGANKIWAIPQKDAKVQNLTGGFDGVPSALEYMDRIKMWMHELTGVPQTALGQEQEISNTSGVALAIQYFPTILKHNLKKTQYGNGLRKISQLALKTLFTFEPGAVNYDPSTDGIIRDGQPPRVDPGDPQVYDIDVIFPPPLPQDELVLLNEIQAKLVLELESKKGALKVLGEQFPDEKLQELWNEQVDDLKMAAAKRIINAQVDSAIIALTGIIPVDGGEPADGAQTQETTTRKPDGTTTKQTKETKPGITPPVLPSLPGIGDIGGAMGDMGMQTIKDLVVQAAGTKLPQRRIVDKNTNV